MKAMILAAGFGTRLFPLTIDRTKRPDAAAPIGSRACSLSLVYLPHLDYNLQRLGPDDPKIREDVRAIDSRPGGCPGDRCGGSGSWSR
mgnify:CR=1 FL=1